MQCTDTIKGLTEGNINRCFDFLFGVLWYEMTSYLCKYKHAACCLLTSHHMVSGYRSFLGIYH